MWNLDLVMAIFLTIQHWHDVAKIHWSSQHHCAPLVNPLLFIYIRYTHHKIKLFRIINLFDIMQLVRINFSRFANQLQDARDDERILEEILRAQYSAWHSRS